MIDRVAGELPIAEVGNGPLAGAAQGRDPRDPLRSAPTATSRAPPRNIPTGPNALRWVNGLLGVLRDAGLPDNVIAYAVDILPLYAIATAYEESLYTAKELPDSGAEYIAELRRYFASLPVDRFPHIVAMAVPLTARRSRTSGSSSGWTRWSGGSRR